MWINKSNGASYNFKAPAIIDDANSKNEVYFPTFESKSVTLSSNAGSATINRTETLLDLGASNLAAAATLTLTADSNLPAGAKVRVKFPCGATKYDVTVKKDAADNGVVLIGIASTMVCKSVMWTGTAWIALH